MRRTKDLFEKIGGNKGTFQARMGMMKGRNSKELKKQRRLRRGGKNTQKKYTIKILRTWITMTV